MKAGDSGGMCRRDEVEANVRVCEAELNSRRRQARHTEPERLSMVFDTRGPRDTLESIWARFEVMIIYSVWKYGGESQLSKSSAPRINRGVCTGNILALLRTVQYIKPCTV